MKTDIGMHIFDSMVPVGDSMNLSWYSEYLSTYDSKSEQWKFIEIGSARIVYLDNEPSMTLGNLLPCVWWYPAFSVTVPYKCFYNCLTVRYGMQYGIYGVANITRNFENRSRKDFKYDEGFFDLFSSKNQFSFNSSPWSTPSLTYTWAG